MQWLELIQLRSADNNRKLLESKLQQLVDEVYRETNRKAVTAYSRVWIDTDFCLFIRHETKEPETEGSPLGLRLAAALKEFGLVDYSIWREMSSK
jgi:hypothetical protein